MMKNAFDCYINSICTSCAVNSNIKSSDKNTVTIRTATSFHTDSVCSSRLQSTGKPTWSKCSDDAGASHRTHWKWAWIKSQRRSFDAIAKPFHCGGRMRQSLRYDHVKYSSALSRRMHTTTSHYQIECREMLLVWFKQNDQRETALNFKHFARVER